MKLFKLGRISIVLMALVALAAFNATATAPFDKSIEVPAIFVDTIEMEFILRGPVKVAYDKDAIDKLAGVDNAVAIDNIVVDNDNSRIEIPVGQPVVFFVTNAGYGMPHDMTFAMPAENIAYGTEGSQTDIDFARGILEFILSDLGESIDADDAFIYVPVVGATGATNWVTLVPTKPGEYTFICSIPGHAWGGMIGTIVVTE